jgi:hypothetical protein
MVFVLYEQGEEGCRGHACCVGDVPLDGAFDEAEVAGDVDGHQRERGWWRRPIRDELRALRACMVFYGSSLHEPNYMTYFSCNG